MKKIGVIYGSSRPSTVGKTVAEWFVSKADAPEGFEYEMIDLFEIDLPMFNEPLPPMRGEYQHDHTKDWAAKIMDLGAVIFVATEYNHAPTPILKNALDYLYAEWKDMPTAFISYGARPISNAVNVLREVMSAMNAQQIGETLHIAPAYAAVTNEGVDESKSIGDTPAVIVQKLSELV